MYDLRKSLSDPNFSHHGSKKESPFSTLRSSEGRGSFRRVLNKRPATLRRKERSSSSASRRTSLHDDSLKELKLKNFKVVLVGSEQSGKTAIATRFMQNDFVEEYDPTIADIFRKIDVLDDGRSIRMDILDTAGSLEYRSVRKNDILLGDVFILVFSLSSRKSFEEVQLFYKQCCQLRGTGFPMILVGNKSDLEQVDREIFSNEGRNLAKSYNCEYLETSAFNNENITKAFHHAAELNEQRLQNEELERLKPKNMKHKEHTLQLYAELTYKQVTKNRFITYTPPLPERQSIFI